jgi:DNA-binding transcriptional MerR regulator
MPTTSRTVPVPLLQVGDVAERFHVTVQTIRNWVATGQFPEPTRLGKRCYWTEQQLARVLRGRKDK